MHTLPLADASLELRCPIHRCRLDLTRPGDWSPLHRESAGDFSFDLDALFCPMDGSKGGGVACHAYWVVEL